MDIEEIVQILNDESDRFEFGKLQEIRKERLGLQRIPNRKPFRTISRDGTYAYHVGGIMNCSLTSVSSILKIKRFFVGALRSHCKRLDRYLT